MPIRFKLTASSMMNSFFIPALAGQVYAMPGMETRLNAVINKPGIYKGFSANYSGDGFSHMHFKFHGLSQVDFAAWVKNVRQGRAFGRDEYLALEQPSKRDPVQYFGQVDPELYNAILNMCVAPDKMCAYEMMQIDMAGGAGIDSQDNQERLRYDNRRANLPPAHH